MNSVIIMVIFVVSIVAVSHQQSVKDIRRDWRKRAAPQLTRCMCQTKVNPDLVEGFFEFGEITNDPCFKCTVKCVEQAHGIMSPTGKINTTRFGFYYGITDDIISKCAYNTHVDLCENSFERFSCAYTMVAARAAVNSNNINPQIIVPSLSTKMFKALPQFVLQHP